MVSSLDNYLISSLRGNSREDALTLLPRRTVTMRSILATATLLLLSAPPLAARSTAADPALVAAVADLHRTAANRLRDRYRHPVKTLDFFGVTDRQTVVEFLPSGGWYTEILAPLLDAKGHYIALAGSTPKAQAGLTKLLAGGGPRYARATTASIDTARGRLVGYTLERNKSVERAVQPRLIHSASS
jgi:predicted methyltransferase